MSDQYPYMYEDYYFRVSTRKGMQITIENQKYKDGITVEFLIRIPGTRGTSHHQLFQTPFYALHNDLDNNGYIKDVYIIYKHINLTVELLKELKKNLKHNKETIRGLFESSVPGINTKSYYNLLVNEEPELPPEFFYYINKDGEIVNKEDSDNIYNFYKNSRNKKLGINENSPLQTQLTEINNSLNMGSLDMVSTTATTGLPAIVYYPKESLSTRTTGKKNYTRISPSSSSSSSVMPSIVATNRGHSQFRYPDVDDISTNSTSSLPSYTSTSSLPSYNKVSGSKTARKSKR